MVTPEIESRRLKLVRMIENIGIGNYDLISLVETDFKNISPEEICGLHFYMHDQLSKTKEGIKVSDYLEVHNFLEDDFSIFWEKQEAANNTATDLFRETFNLHNHSNEDISKLKMSLTVATIKNEQLCN